MAASVEPQNQLLEDAFVGRQPIFDRKLDTFAYELLFRSSEHNRAIIQDGEQATAELMLNAFAEIGLEQIVGHYPAFVNVTEDFILSGCCESLPHERVVIEVLEDVRPTPAVIQALRELKALGYVIALDDFVLAPEFLPLVEQADIIKVDLPLVASNELSNHVEILRQYDVKLLAEKVESMDEFDLCLELGFDYFQGYLFCKPSIVKGKKVGANRISAIRLISKLQDPHVTAADIAETIQTEPSLAVKLIRYVNSALCGLEYKIESIQHAVTLVGLRKIRTICSLTALVSATGNKPTEFTRMVLVRAKMAENIATEIGLAAPEQCFLAGLFSAIDGLLDLPMDEAIEMLPISEEIRDAITTRKGKIGLVIECVLAYERGGWERLDQQEISLLTARQAFLNAIHWVNETLPECQK